MNELDTRVPAYGGRLDMPRSRGAASGFLLILLGVWGGIIPFVGPYIHFAYTPDQVWTWTAARGWLEVLPAAVTVLGGLLLLTSRNRGAAMFGSWLAVLAGAWFTVGTLFAIPLGIGAPGTPVASSNLKLAVLETAYFYGLGVVIVFFGAMALGRLSVRSLRDIRYARRPAAAAAVPTERAAAPAADTAAPREPVTEKAAATPRTEATEAEPRHRRGRLFGRRRQPTPAGR